METILLVIGPPLFFVVCLGWGFFGGGGREGGRITRVVIYRPFGHDFCGGGGGGVWWSNDVTH